MYDIMSVLNSREQTNIDIEAEKFIFDKSKSSHVNDVITFNTASFNLVKQEHLQIILKRTRFWVTISEEV
jgi:hypothetical protein